MQFDPVLRNGLAFDEPARPASGIDTVLVNGRPVWRDGAPTGERPGRALRRREPFQEEGHDG